MTKNSPQLVRIGTRSYDLKFNQCIMPPAEPTRCKLAFYDRGLYDHVIRDMVAKGYILVTKTNPARTSKSICTLLC